MNPAMHAIERLSGFETNIGMLVADIKHMNSCKRSQGACMHLASRLLVSTWACRFRQQLDLPIFCASGSLFVLLLIRV